MKSLTKDVAVMTDAELKDQAVRTGEETGRLRILCVDDESSVLKSLQRLLRGNNFIFFPASCAKDGLFFLESNAVDVIISDMRMPEMSGAEFLAEVARLYPDTVRILLTGYSDLESIVDAVNGGRIHRYLRKPWSNDELVLVLKEVSERLHLERENRLLVAQVEAQNLQLKDMNERLEEKVQQRTKQMLQALSQLRSANMKVSENLRSTIKVFYNLISLNPHLGGKTAVEIGELCRLLAVAFELDKKAVRDIQLAGLLFELGLAGQHDVCLEKAIYDMNADELAVYRQHPVRAHLALAPAGGLQGVATIIKHQYEYFDGSGSPGRLSASEIPMGSRILAVARDYVLAVRGKLQKVRLSKKGALRLLEMNSNREYDACILSRLPDVLPDLEQETLAADERVVSTRQLGVGMMLSRNLYNQKDILLLPEGHRFTHETVNRLRSFEEVDKQLLEIYVLTK
ncbi:response regulator [Pontibacterium granulatum]|uniref:HD domain-containing phosphohydrolase n=1 Tax=Pontibacterium granulatum TaxID=2036029 RepID=UPI00249B462D|nr:HD domain-containing phosphohydrolase [Pontibacterium granulatum]MDI3324954.1 response regulator [Pontibacterium granulatum]